jgi:hypothetical protein
MLALTPPTPFATLNAPTVIKAYAGWTAWDDVDAHARQHVIKARAPGGTVTTRPERSRVEDPLNSLDDGVAFDLGPDSLGRPSIVVGVCAGRSCHLHIGRLPDRRSRQIGNTAQRDMPVAVTFWRKRLVWSDASRTLHLRTAAGATPRLVKPFAQPHADVEEAELNGNLLAATLNYDDPTAPEDNAVALALLNVETRHRETLATEQPGEGGQMFTGPTFVDGHTLSWLLTCHGDPEGCSRRFGVFRRDLRTRRTVFARDMRQHFGFAALSNTTVLLGPANSDCPGAGRCRIERRRLTER